MPPQKTLRTTFFLLVICVSLTCEKSPTGPEPFKDPRTYTWTIDTLAYPGSFQTAMRDIWGSSPNDVYVVGHNDQNRGLMWHYDGTNWTDVKLSTTQGGNIQGPIDLSTIYGFSATNIFAVGDRIYQNPKPPPNFLDGSLIIHFDGRQWREQKVTGGRKLQAIWGSSPSNIWAAGWGNYIFHFNGTVWRKDSLPVTVQGDGFFQVDALEGNPSGDVFAIGNTHHNSLARTIFYFFRRQRESWVLVDSFFVEPGRVERKWGYGDLWVSPSGTLYSCGGGIHKWNGTTWIRIFDHPNFLSRITGASDKNIFVVGHLGTVLHFNGQDWYQYQRFADPNNVLWGVWTDGKEVMIVGFTATYPQKTLILRGK